MPNVSHSEDKRTMPLFVCGGSLRSTPQRTHLHPPAAHAAPIGPLLAPLDITAPPRLRERLSPDVCDLQNHPLPSGNGHRPHLAMLRKLGGAVSTFLRRWELAVNRQRLLEQIRHRAAPITVLVAPAGYGKTYIAQRIARLEPRWGEVDCFEPAAPRIAVHVVARLAAAIGLEVDLGEEPGEIAERIKSAWGALSTPLTLILDNAECIDADDAVTHDLLETMVVDCPADAKVIICSRRESNVSRSVAPHHVTTMGPEQLAFDDSEMHHLFARTNVSEPVLYRISRLTEGWPVAALYCERLASDGSSDLDTFEKLSPTAFASLFDYVDQQVLAHLPEVLLDAFCGAVGVDDVFGDEIDEHWRVSGRSLSRELSRFQVVRIGSEHRIEICPLLRLVARDRYSAKVRVAQLSLAQSRLASDNRTGAALCYLEAGEIERAAQLLRTPDGGTLDVSSYVLPRLPEGYDPATLSSYPEVWTALIGARRLSEPSDVLANEAHAVLGSLDAHSSPILVDTALALSAITLMDAGRIAEAGAALARARNIPDDGPHDVGELHVMAARATMSMTEGRYEDSLVAWYKIQRHIVPQKTWLSQLSGIEISAARARGQWEIEYSHIERMVAAAQQGGAPAIIGNALAEGTFGSWLAQEDDLFENYRTRLDLVLRAHDFRGLSNFHLAALGRRLSVSSGGSWKWNARGSLMAGAAEVEPDRAAECIKIALASADRAGDVFLRVLTRIAIAEKIPTTRSKRLQEALSLAQTTDSSALCDSIDHLIRNGEPEGMLSAFINRLRRRSSIFEPADSEVRFAFCLADMTVSRDGSKVNISHGGSALLAALAVEPRAVASDTLRDRLWPDLPLDSARNALKMCVRRTRHQLGTSDAIVTTAGAYALGDGVDVDLREIDRLRSVIVRKAENAEDVRLVEQHFERLLKGRPKTFLEGAWFEGTEQRLKAATREFGECLARVALSHDDHLRALQIGHRLIELDPFDEMARSVTMSAYLAAHQRGAALLEYRQYQKLLKDELQVEPSAQLKEMLDGNQ